jgi:hypothetical protein
MKYKNRFFLALLLLTAHPTHCMATIKEAVLTCVDPTTLKISTAYSLLGLLIAGANSSAFNAPFISAQSGYILVGTSMVSSLATGLHPKDVASDPLRVLRRIRGAVATTAAVGSVATIIGCMVKSSR